MPQAKQRTEEQEAAIKEARKEEQAILDGEQEQIDQFIVGWQERLAQHKEASKKLLALGVQPKRFHPIWALAVQRERQRQVNINRGKPYAGVGV